MNEAFFVAGPPRSGTTWLANALNYGSDIFCFHELERKITKATDLDDVVGQMVDLMQQRHQWFVGNCSSGMLLFSNIQDPLVIIHRDWDDVESSLRMAFVEWGMRDHEFDMQTIIELHERMCALHPNALHVDFDDLFKLPALERIWRHLFRGMQLFPREEMEERLRMKVTLKEFDYPWDPMSDIFGINERSEESE